MLDAGRGGTVASYTAEGRGDPGELERAREDDAIEENPRVGDRVWDYMGVTARV
jgi:hypothetical protein